MCVLLDMYEERGEARGIHEINTLNLRLLDDNRLEDMQRAMVDTDYQKRTYERIWHWKISNKIGCPSKKLAP